MKLQVLAVAATLTLLNAAMPVCVDDPAYLAYAVEFLAHPLDPYGFEFGTPLVRPANLLLVPPVVPYWLALGLSCFGENLLLLKMWLFPFAWILAASASALLNRFAPSVRVPMLWMAVLSPTILPGFCFMLDVPALALGLAAIALTIRATDRDSIRGMALAGLVAGLAIQTKYNAAVASAAIGVWCLLNRRFVGLAVAGGTAACVAVGWEWFVAVRSGESHFVVHFGQRKGSAAIRFVHLALPTLSQFSGVAAAFAILGLRAAGSRWAFRLGLIVPLGVLVLILAPSQQPLATSANGKPVLTISNLVYGSWALLASISFMSITLKLLRGGGIESRFLLAWFAFELAGCIALSPFPATRRVLGLAFVFAILVARTTHLAGLHPRTVRLAALAGIGYAGVFFTTLLMDTTAARSAGLELARRERGVVCHHLTWEGLNYCSTREGLPQLQLNLRVPKVGDHLAVMDVSDLRGFVEIQPWIALERIDVIEIGDGFPLKSLPSFASERHRSSIARAPASACSSIASSRSSSERQAETGSSVDWRIGAASSITVIFTGPTTTGPSTSLARAA